MFFAVEIKKLKKDFAVGLGRPKLRAIDNLSLQVEDNQIFGLLGPNGSGKSTIFKILLGLVEPTAGHCTIYGSSGRKLSTRHSVGYLPENPYFYKHLTGVELLYFYGRVCGVPCSKLRKRISELIELVGLEEAAQRRIKTYSKGMLQRIGMGQALIHDPRLLILDEPIAGLDPLGATKVLEIIRRLKQDGKTILLSSHLLTEMEGLCDRVAILDKGKRIFEDSVHRLVQKQNLKSLLIRNYDQAANKDLRTVLNDHGSCLVRVEDRKVGLSKIFLDVVSRRDNH